MKTGSSHLSQGQSPSNRAGDFLSVWNNILSCGLVSTGWAALLLAFSTSNVRASEFGISGDISCALLMSDGNVFTNFSFPYTAMVGTNGWNIKVTFGKDWYLSVGSDETNVYSILEDPNLEGTKRKSSMAPGEVSEGDYPFNEGWYVTFPWWAFCSSAHFGKFGMTNIPAPWAEARSDPTAPIYSEQIKWTDADPKLPLSIIFTVSQELKNNPQKLDWLNAQYLKEEELKKLEYYNDGFVGGEYTVTDVTNYNGLVLPVKFEAKHYLPLPGSRHFLEQIFTGTITQIFSPKLSSFVPEITQQASVADFRFRDTSLDVNYINYPLTNGVWITGKPAELQAKLAEKRGRSRHMMSFWKPDTAVGAKRQWAFIFVMGITLLPLFWMFGKWWQQKRKIT